MCAIGWGSLHCIIKSGCGVGFIVFMIVGLALSINNVSVEAVKASPTELPVRKPGLYFNQQDTGICRKDSGWLEATVKVSLPEGTSAYLQASYHIIHPYESDATYIDGGVVRNGDSYTFRAYWPGIKPGDKMVEIHWGAALLDIDSKHPVQTAGLDYFWYPYICQINEDSEPPKPPYATADPTFKPTKTPVGPNLPTNIPGKSDPLPTLAPPLNRSQDRYVVLPETGGGYSEKSTIHFFVYNAVLLVGLFLMLFSFQKNYNTEKS